VELPLTKHVSPGERSTTLENKTRPGHQGSCSARHQHLAWEGSIGNSTRDLKSSADERPLAELAFAGMNACTHVDANR
jgi:hypothetical protein